MADIESLKTELLVRKIHAYAFYVRKLVNMATNSIFESTYSSALDTALILTIASDHDLSNPAELENAREILDALKSGSEENENGGYNRFDDFLDEAVDNKRGDDNLSGRSGNSVPWSRIIDETALSEGLSSLDFETSSSSDLDRNGPEDRPFGVESDNLDEDGKVRLLSSIFPTLKPYDIQYSLKKAKMDLNSTVDDLMTRAFLEETGSKSQGIDAFLETGYSNLPRKQKKKKKKKNGRWIEQEASNSSTRSPSSPGGKWDTGKQDIEFISTRTATPIAQISSIYYKYGASTPATISHIIESHQALKIAVDDPILHTKAIDLAHEFPTVSASSLQSIVQITNPSIQYARELAKALELHPNSSKPTIEVEIRHAPINLHPTPEYRKEARKDALSLERATANAAKYTEQRDTDFQKASQAYRRGKSDHLMGAAAAYYSQQGRDADALARIARSDVADALVANQTSRTELDLHGMNVNDAKRIVKERVTTWWHELGMTEGGRPVVGSRYHIVTGMGHHSNGGVGKLGPAVCKMLVRDGWKVEVQPGQVFVLGIAQDVKRR